MIVLWVSGLVGVLFLLAGLVMWGVARLVRRRVSFLKVVKWTGAVYLIFLPLLIFVGLPILSAYMIASAGTRPMDARLEIDPQTYGCPFESVDFAARDGIPLHGWWMQGEENLPAILLGHGLFRDRKEVVERACRLNRLGYTALVYDLRRHGGGRAGRISLGYQERLDVLGAYDLARARGEDRIVPLGVSMSATATLLALPELDGEVEAVIADSPFVSLEETIARHVHLFLGLPAFPFVPIFNAFLGYLADFPPEKLNVVPAVAESEQPILLIYGGGDPRMPAATAQEIFQAIPGDSGQMAVFPGAGHAAAWRVDPDRYIEVIVSFLDSVAAD